MADYSAGEPLSGRHGIVLYSAQVDKGTPVTPTTGLGIGTFSWTEIADPQYVYGLGSPDPITMRPGTTMVEWSIDLSAVQTGLKTFLLKVQRVAGVVPWVTLGLGWADDVGTPNILIDQISDCKVQRVSLTVDRSRGSSLVTGQISGIGLLLTELTTGSAAILTSTPWMARDATLTRAGSAFPARSITVDISNEIVPEEVIPGSAASNPRLPAYLSERNRAFTGSIVRYKKAGVALQASTLAEAAMVLTLTNPVDSVAITFTYANQTFGREERRMAPDGILFTAPWQARGLTIS